MKYIFFLSIFVLHQFTWSQKLIGSFSAGYHYVLPNEQSLSFIVNSFHQVSNPWFWNLEDYSFKQLLSLDISLGYEFHNNLGLEITGSYLQPIRLHSNDEFTTRTFEAKFWRINPKLSLKLPFKKCIVYSKIGLAIGSGEISYKQSFKNNGNWNLGFNEAMLKYEYAGPISFGFTGSIGINKSVSPRIAIFSEIQFSSQNFSPSKGKMTEYKIDGYDELTTNEFETYHSEIEFGDQSESYTLNPTDKNQAQKLYKHTYSLNGIGISIGVFVTLWEKKKVEELED
jgi:hypothetical protein